MIGLASRGLIPYATVGLFWLGLENAWLALLAYHGLILGCRKSSDWRGIAVSRWLTLVSGIFIFAGPLVYFLLPMVVRAPVGEWLADFGLSGPWLLAMVPYCGLIHPILEQHYWAPLCERSVWSHFLFAGYHLLVLYSLVKSVWLFPIFAVLAGVSWFWSELRKRRGGALAATVSHVLADTGIVIAAWLRV